MHPEDSMSLARTASTQSHPYRSGTCLDRTARTRPARPLVRLSPPHTPPSRRCPLAQRSPARSACTVQRSA
eukprot:4917656-Prymnesium_polylepis.1